MVAAGLTDWLLGRGILGLDATRKTLASYYLPLGGSGIEIGALHSPLPLPGGAVARYLDCHTAEELRQFNASTTMSIAEPDLIADGFALNCIATTSQDFVIANHVLEHATDALGTLENWLCALRPGGILFVAVPIGACCFDRGRAVTSLEHFIEDRRFTTIGNAEAMRQRNREHVEEHLRFAAPAMARLSGTSWQGLHGDARENEIERLTGRDSYLIHHHVFSPESFAVLLGLLSKQARIERIAQSSVEIVGVMRKLA
jgi:SAM-dependent methyltransferase